MDKCSRIRLLFLASTATAAFGSLDAFLVGLDLAAGHAAKQAGAGLPRPLQVAGSRLTEEVDFDEVGLEHALQRDDALDEQRVRVLEVQVHDAHHANAHELGADQRAPLLLVICLDGRRHALGFLGAAHLRRLDVLDDCHVLLLVDLELNVEVDTKDNEVGQDVGCADEVEDIWVFKGDLLRQLHHKPAQKESAWKQTREKCRGKGLPVLVELQWRTHTV